MDEKKIDEKKLEEVTGGKMVEVEISQEIQKNQCWQCRHGLLGGSKFCPYTDFVRAGNQADETHCQFFKVVL